MAVLGWAILGVIVINAAFAFIQEYKAERAVQALHDMLPDKAWVTRSGLTLEIPRSDIVVGGTAPLPVWIFGPLALGAVILLFAEEVRKYLARLVRGGVSNGQ